MWSGPRNLSTAMMYSFAARQDFVAVDEPFYAAFLAASGADHPMREEVLAHGETDPEAVSAALAAKLGTPHVYEKHMTHHMAPGFPLDWLEACRNVFLIRHPARVVASYAAKREVVPYDELGFERQLEIFERVEAEGGRPVVVDSADILADPPGMLRALCDAVGLAFDPAMLHWPAGPKPFDGIWARHWYGSVHASTGFGGPEGALPELDGEAAALAARALPIYEALHARRLRA